MRIPDNANKFVEFEKLGYFLGGYSGALTAVTDRILFTTGVTAANTVSNLKETKYSAGSVSDCSLYGYISGGDNPTGTQTVSTERFTYSTEVGAANTASNLSTKRTYPAGVSDVTTYGYLGGGYTGANIMSAVTDIITFSTSVTAANTASNISLARAYFAGLGDRTTYGYAAGGYSGNRTAVTDRITFSTSVTAANTASNLSQARDSGSTFNDNGTYGYFLGGFTSSTQVVTTDRITFATGATAANTVSNQVVGRNYAAGVSDRYTYGYVGGGGTGNYTATSERTTFSTGATAANTVSNLSLARSTHTGLSRLT